MCILQSVRISTSKGIQVMTSGITTTSEAVAREDRCSMGLCMYTQRHNLICNLECMCALQNLCGFVSNFAHQVLRKQVACRCTVLLLHFPLSSQLS